MLPVTSGKVKELTPECQIWAAGRVYSLLREQATDVIRDEKGAIWYKFMANERLIELDVMFPEPYITNDPNIPEPMELETVIVSGGSDLSGGRFAVGSATHALYAVLNGSGWSVGTVDVTGTHDLETEKESRLALVKAIQQKWGGYLLFDSVNRVVHLRDGGKWKNYTGFQIRYAKNLKHITRIQSNRIITRLYPFGHDDLDIASVNGGVKYIENYSYTPTVGAAVYKNQDIYDPQELLEKATAELALICRPRYVYNVKIADLRTLPEYSHEDFAVGDMVDVIDPVVAPNKPQIRIIKHKYNVFMPWDCELELGDPLESLAEQLKASFGTSGFVDGKFNGSGKYSGYNIENMSIGNAKIKNLDAAKITTGYLSADRIQAGSIGANKIKTEELIVGTNIAMGPDAKISWGQVTDADTYSLQAWENSGYKTYIDENGIYTGTVAANKILIGGDNGSISFVDLSNKPFIPSTASEVGALPDNTYIPTTADITTITKNYVQTPNLITNIGYVNKDLHLGLGYKTSSSLSFDGIGGIDAHDNSLYFSAMTALVFNTGVSINNGAYFAGSVDFSSATVTGLDPKYATQSWVSSGYAVKNHSHSEYASSDHSHSAYATTLWVTQRFARDDHLHPVYLKIDSFNTKMA